MTPMAAGLAFLLAWPLYNLALVVLAMRNRAVDRRARRLDAGTPTWHGPDTFWIVIPCLNEERVVGRTVAAALGLSGPPGSRTYVLVVDDASDDRTPEVLAGIVHPNLCVLRRTLPDARRGKGEALNAAFAFIDSCTRMYGSDPRRVAVGVLDGDGRGSPNLLTEVARAMDDPSVAAVQCRVRIHNRDRLLGAVQDLEFACIANANQAMRNTLGTVGLGGNGQFTRLSALARLGTAPWSKCLVEDLELGLRLHLAGDAIRYLSRASVTQQGVVAPGRLLRQRTRWAQGNLQCVRYVPRLVASRQIGNVALLEMLYYLLAPWFNAIGTIVIAGLWAFAGWRLRLLQVGATLAVLGCLPYLLWAVVHRLQLRDERFGRMLLAGLAYPAFLFLGLVGTWRAVGRQILRRNAWAKTERLLETENPVESLVPQG